MNIQCRTFVTVVTCHFLGLLWMEGLASCASLPKKIMQKIQQHGHQETEDTWRSQIMNELVKDKKALDMSPDVRLRYDVLQQNLLHDGSILRNPEGRKEVQRVLEGLREMQLKEHVHKITGNALRLELLQQVQDIRASFDNYKLKFEYTVAPTIRPIVWDRVIVAMDTFVRRLDDIIKAKSSAPSTFPDVVEQVQKNRIDFVSYAQTYFGSNVVEWVQTAHDNLNALNYLDSNVPELIVAKGERIVLEQAPFLRNRQKYRYLASTDAPAWFWEEIALDKLYKVHWESIHEKVYVALHRAYVANLHVRSARPARQKEICFILRMFPEHFYKIFKYHAMTDWSIRNQIGVPFLCR